MAMPVDLLGGEGKNIEYKERLPEKADQYLKTVVAFSNTAGGKILIGIKGTSKEVIGVPNDSVFGIMDQIANTISDKVFPQVVPNIYMQALENKTVIVIEVYPGSARPYYIKSLGKDRGTFVRVGGTSRPVDAPLLKDLELSGVGRSYDTQVIIGETLDFQAAEQLSRTISNHRRDQMSNEETNKAFANVTLNQLERWEVLRNVGGELKPTVAFDLLTKNTNAFAKIHCGRFKGETRSVFVDKKEMTGPIFEQIEMAYQFVLGHINLGVAFEGVYRVEQYEIPPAVFREAIANAVTHRNYLDASAIQVLVFDDRLEITSPGMLYGGLTVELIKTGKSKIRNKAIAEVFSQMGLIESWGTGIQRMIEGCRKAGIPEPVFEELGDSFRVTIYRDARSQGNASRVRGNSGDYQTNKDIVLKELAQRDLTRRSIENLTGLSKTGSINLLNQLLADGVVRTTGRGRSTRYQLKK